MSLGDHCVSTRTDPNISNRNANLLLNELYVFSRLLRQLLPRSAIRDITVPALQLHVFDFAVVAFQLCEVSWEAVSPCLFVAVQISRVVGNGNLDGFKTVEDV